MDNANNVSKAMSWNSQPATVKLSSVSCMEIMKTVKNVKQGLFWKVIQIQIQNYVYQIIVKIIIEGKILVYNV